MSTTYGRRERRRLRVAAGLSMSRIDIVFIVIALSWTLAIVAGFVYLIVQAFHFQPGPPS